MISKKIAIEVLNASLSTGADYAEIFYEDSHETTVVLENSKVETSSSKSLNGVGLRLLKENQCIYGYTNDLSKKGLLALANSLNKSFNGKQTIVVDHLDKVKAKDRNKIKTDYDLVPLEEKVQLLKDADEAMLKINDPRIVRRVCSLNCWHRGVAVFNSKSKWFKRDTQFATYGVLAIASDGKGFEQGYVRKGCQDDLSYFRSGNAEVTKCATKAVETALAMLEAPECPAGKMPVVIGNGWGGVLFHESCGHPLEASAVAKGLSFYKPEQIGTKVASKVVSAVDDSTIPYAWGSVDIDDEGNPGEKRVLIKNGVLKDFMIDDLNGRRMNRKGNGACRRQNYRYIPTSRMSNTYICPGKSTPEEIIKATKLGLYAVSFGGGQVDPSTGEFNFGCSEAYIIRDGKVCEMVKGATLIGKGYDILKNIDMVANDLDLAEGFCGASSGRVYTSVGQPTLRVLDCTVGGRGGELK